MSPKIPSEADVDGWDMETTLHYGREGLHDFRQDPDELAIRRNILITSKFADWNVVLREVVMLSLAAKDIETVRLAIRWLEDAGDPAMGYYAYKAMEGHDESEVAEEFLKSAADHGHFPALRVLTDRRAKERGLFGIFCKSVFRLSHAWKVYRVARQNPNDLRLR